MPTGFPHFTHPRPGLAVTSCALPANLVTGPVQGGGLDGGGLQGGAVSRRRSAAYRKAGFGEEGRIRETVLHDGRFHDELAMGILASEWHAIHD